jgi:hypothetical protein
VVTSTGTGIADSPTGGTSRCMAGDYDPVGLVEDDADDDAGVPARMHLQKRWLL